MGGHPASLEESDATWKDKIYKVDCYRGGPQGPTSGRHASSDSRYSSLNLGILKQQNVTEVTLYQL